MTLKKAHLIKLLKQICDCQPDQLDCGGCFHRLAEFAEAELAGKELCEAQQAIRTHLLECPCCMDEYQALLEGLSELEDKNP